ncbi:MAG: hypothetical protein ACKVJG_24450 [Candidatus Latescibacterota bacterium]|jgi:hypothetical protein
MPWVVAVVVLGVSAQGVWAQAVLEVAAIERTAFVRMEKDAFATVEITNLTDTTLAKGRVGLRLLNKKKTFFCRRWLLRSAMRSSGSWIRHCDLGSMN